MIAYFMSKETLLYDALHHEIFLEHFVGRKTVKFNSYLPTAPLGRVDLQIIAYVEDVMQLVL